MDSGEGNYVLTGTLDGLHGPGRREVVDLTIRRIDSGTVDLGVLRAFPDLIALELDGLSDVDLSPLADLHLTDLRLANLEDTDLVPIGRLSTLTTLSLVGLRSSASPGLVLPPSLRYCAVSQRAPAGSPAFMARLIEETAWGRCPDLQVLALAVDSDLPGAPAEADLSFLEDLPELITLELVEGIAHGGPRPSPLEPPFEGLSRRLRRVRYESDDAEATAKALRDVLPDAEFVAISPRVEADPVTPWQITRSDTEVERWLVYGRLHRGTDGETEYDACARALRRLRSEDPSLADRVEFDPEADGTGIEAPTREDLVRALGILGLPADERGRG